MTGKELIEKVLRNEEVERVPWVPYAGVHAGKLLGYKTGEVYTDEDKLVESLLEVNKLYKPDGQPVMFDLQIEAEILGCKLVWKDGAPPAVGSHPLSATDEIPTHIPGPDEGRMPMALNATRRLKEAVGDTTALYGLFCGPFTLASHLRGTKFFRDMTKNPEYASQLLEYTTKIGKAMVDYYVEAGADVISVVDPLVSQISPKHFAKLMHGPFKAIFDYIREKGRFSAFFVCGNATFNIDEMCKTGPDSIGLDENCSMIECKKISDAHNVVIAGNLPLTTVMLYGNQQDNMKAVIDLLDSLDHKNLIIAPGCDMAYDTPIENTTAAQQAVFNPEAARQMLANYQAEAIEFEGELPDYENLEKPLIEAFTLDSDSCAACTYMWAAVKDAQAHYGDKIETIEYKYNDPQNIARMHKIGVKQLPSIYINGELKYSSIIPSQDEFFAEIDKAL